MLAALPVSPRSHTPAPTAAATGLVAHCDVRWADSGLCSGGPRLRLRVYGGERSCTPDLAAAALSAPPGVAALACFLARANCSLAYGAWQWDPLAAASSAAGAPASAPPSSNAPAFCADVRFRPEEAGAACVARCAAAFKVALETWCGGAWGEGWGWGG